MPTLDDLRTQGEAELEQILARLDRRHRTAVRAALRRYGRVQDIPEIFWVEMEREIEAEQVAAIALLILAADEWTSDEVNRQGVGISSLADRNQATRQADTQLRTTAGQTVSTLRTRLRRKIEDMQTAGPGDVGELTKDGIEQALDGTFSDKRRQGIATDETTKAFSVGQKNAAERISGGDGAISDTGQRVTIELVWQTEHDNRTCPRCAPLDGTTEDVWGKVFPDGPGPEAHPNCRCSLLPRVIVQASEAA